MWLATVDYLDLGVVAVTYLLSYLLSFSIADFSTVINGDYSCLINSGFAQGFKDNITCFISPGYQFLIVQNSNKLPLAYFQVINAGRTPRPGNLYRPYLWLSIPHRPE